MNSRTLRAIPETYVLTHFYVTSGDRRLNRVPSNRTNPLEFGETVIGLCQTRDVWGSTIFEGPGLVTYLQVR
jgi:hypothetical protein